MWTRNHDGKLFWSDAAKLKLVALLRQNPGALIGDRSSPKKNLAWQKIYEGLIKAGMPATSIDRVKQCWTRIQLTAKVVYGEQVKEYSKNGRMVPISKLNQNIIDILNDLNLNENIRNMMPKPKLVVVKQEPIDDYEDPTPAAKVTQSMYNQQLNMNPVVVLNRIDENDLNVKTEEDNVQALSPNGSSTKYWNLMEKIAENDLKLKLAQRENEEERMEREREIHQKTSLLLDLKIQVQQMQMRALRGEQLFE